MNDNDNNNAGTDRTKIKATSSSSSELVLLNKSSSKIQSNNITSNNNDDDGSTCNHQQSNYSYYVKSFISGGVGGFFNQIIGYPLDLIKVRQQTLPTSSSSSSSSSIVSIIYSIKQNDRNGILGLYRGIAGPMTAIIPMYALQFFSYDLSKQFVHSYSSSSSSSSSSILNNNNNNTTSSTIDLPSSVQSSSSLSSSSSSISTSFLSQNQQKQQQYQVDEQLAPFQKAIAGGIASIPIALLITVPVERVKCIMQTTTNSSSAAATTKRKTKVVNHKNYKNTLHCIKSLYKDGGISNIYKGSLITLARDVPGTIVWFGTYEYIKLFLSSSSSSSSNSSNSSNTAGSSMNSASNSNNSLSIILSGGIAGMTYWLFVMPIDVIKSRYQSIVIGTTSSGIVNSSTTSSINSNITTIKYTDIIKDIIQNESKIIIKHQNNNNTVSNIFRIIINGFYKGIKPACLRSFPSNAATFYGMETSKRLLDEHIFL